jgi:hypothetical protein
MHQHLQLYEEEDSKKHLCNTQKASTFHTAVFFSLCLLFPTYIKPVLIYLPIA